MKAAEIFVFYPIYPIYPQKIAKIIKKKYFKGEIISPHFIGEIGEMGEIFSHEYHENNFIYFFS